MITTYFLNMMLGNAFHASGVESFPATYYVALSTTVPNSDGSNITEPTGGAYARASFFSMGTPVNGVISIEDDVEFPESTGDWGTIQGFAVYDSASGGNVLMYESLTNPQDIVADNQARFRSGSLKVTLRAVTS